MVSESDADDAPLRPPLAPMPALAARWTPRSRFGIALGRDRPLLGRLAPLGRAAAAQSPGGEEATVRVASSPVRMRVRVPPLEQREKDSRLVQLINLAATRGLGDLDLAPAIRLLEVVGWDVSEAFSRLCFMDADPGIIPAGGRRLPHPRPAGAASRGIVDPGAAADDYDDIDEYDDSVEDEEDIEEEEEEDDTFLGTAEGGVPGDAELGNAATRFFRTGVIGGHVGFLSGADLMRHRVQPRTTRDRLLPHALREDSEVRLHWVVNALIHTQEEAELQDAMRLSAGEAYSGGFNVPPADEAELQRSTTTCVHRKGDEPGQCSVCLCEFEHGDSLRTMRCRHRFHMACVDQWLAQSGQCPVCKQTVGSG